MQKEKQQLESSIKNLDNDIRAKQLTSTASNPLYMQMDEAARKRVEQKDAQIAQYKTTMEQTRRRITDLRNNQSVENILSQNKGDRRLQDKFMELVKIRVQFEQVKNQKAALQEQIDHYYSIESIGMIAGDLIERDLAVVDSALISQSRGLIGKQESNILFINHTATQLTLGKDSAKLIKMNDQLAASTAAPSISGGLGAFHEHATALSKKDGPKLKR